MQRSRPAGGGGRSFIIGEFLKGSTTILCLVFAFYRFQVRLPEFKRDGVKSFCSVLKFPLKMSFRNQIQAPSLACHLS